MHHYIFASVHQNNSQSSFQYLIIIFIIPTCTTSAKWKRKK